MPSKESLLRQLELEKNGKFILHYREVQQPLAVNLILKFNNELRIVPGQKPVKLIKDDKVQALVSQAGLDLDNAKYVIYSYNHFAVISFKKNINNKLDVFFIDAANSDTQDYIISSLAKLNVVASIYRINSDEQNNIQKGEYDCLAFSLYHAYELMKFDMISLLEEPNSLKRKSDDGKIFEYEWNDLPPELVRICQSNSLWEQYKSNNLNIDYSQHDDFRAQLKSNSNDLKHPGNVMPAIREQYINPIYNLVLAKNEKYAKTLMESPNFRIGRYDIILFSSTKQSLTINQFRTLYQEAYQSAFFKNPNSDMKQLLENEGTNIRDVWMHAAANPNSRTAKIVNQLL